MSNEEVEKIEAFVASDWTPAIIAMHEHALKFHKTDPGQVTRFAGEKVRVRLNDDADAAWRAERHLFMGCVARGLEVHPDDAMRLWPDLAENNTNVTICECVLLMD